MKKKLLFVALLAVSAFASAQEIVTATSDEVYPERISVKELSSISHKTNLRGQSSITTELTNGASYTMSIGDVTETQVLSAKDAIAQGRYADMTFLKDFDSLEEFESGEIIGILDEQDYSAYDFPTAAYYDIYGLESLFQAAYAKNIATLALYNLLSTDYIRIHVTNIVYASTDTDGQKIALSARLIYPYSTYSSKKLKLSSIYVDHHTTLFDDATSPSFSFGNMPLCGMCANGYLVVEPDLLGFGVSTTRTQQYIDNENNPRHAADCVLAATNYVKLSQSNTKYTPAYLASNATMINAGGSQGGYTALAMQKYIEQGMDRTLAAKLPVISQTRIYAAPVDPLFSFETFTKLDTLRMSVTLPMMVQGAVVGHPEIMVDENGKPYTIHDYFISDMKTRTWNFSDYGLDRNYNIWQLMNSKKLNSSMFIWALCSTWGELIETGYDNVTFGWMLAHRVMANGILNRDGLNKYSLNYEDNRVKALTKVLKSYNICDPIKWVPNSNISIVHADDDRWVPYQNSTEFVENMQNPMRNGGRSISLETLHNTLELGGHGVTCYIWMLSELYGTDTTTVLETIRALKSSQATEEEAAAELSSLSE